MTNAAYTVIGRMGGLPASALADPFTEGSLDTAKWTSWAEGSGASVAVASDKLGVTLDVTSGRAWAGVYSAEPYDLTGSQAGVKIAALGQANTSGGGSQIGFLLQFGQSYPEQGPCLRFVLTGGYFYCQYQPDTSVDDSVTLFDVTPGNYEPTNWQWWRFIEQDGRLLWQVSPDGSDWSTLASMATAALPFAITALYPTLYGDASATTTDFVAFGEYNTTAPVPGGSGPAGVSASAVVLSSGNEIVQVIPAIQALCSYGDTVEGVREALVLSLQTYMDDDTLAVEFVVGLPAGREVIRVHFDHPALLRDAWPANLIEMPAVPAEGQSATVLGSTYIVYRVHWWTEPEDGQADVRAVLRTPEEYRRVMQDRVLDAG